MSTKNKSSLYFLALLPPKHLCQFIREIKLEIAERFNSRKALKLPAHITLQPPFKLIEEKEKSLFIRLQNFSGKISEFEVILNDFGAFSPRVIFIEVEAPEKIRTLHQELVSALQDFLPSEQSRPIHPHITLATRDLSRDNFTAAWAEFKNRKFRERFIANSFSLFKHDGKNWERLARFEFKLREI